MIPMTGTRAGFIIMTLGLYVLLLAGCVTSPLTPVPHEPEPGNPIPDVATMYRYWGMIEASPSPRETYRSSGWQLDYFGNDETQTLVLGILYDGVYHLTFRPTRGSFVWGTNLLNYATWSRQPAYHPPGSDFRAHSGFLTRYESVRQQVLARVMTHRDYPIVLNGLSLGGALAGLAYFDLQQVAPDLDVTLVTFAAPRVLKRSTVRQLDTAGRLDDTRIIRFVYANDVVPGVPPVWFGYRHFGTNVQIGEPRRLVALSGFDHWPRIRDGIRAMVEEAGLDRSEIGY